MVTEPPAAKLQSDRLQLETDDHARERVAAQVRRPNRHQETGTGGTR